MMNLGTFIKFADIMSNGEEDPAKLTQASLKKEWLMLVKLEIIANRKHGTLNLGKQWKR